MGYLYLLGVALLFSFGGTCVKLAQPYFDASYITFFRFFFGVLVLLVLMMLQRKRFHRDYFRQVKKYRFWLIFGAAVKWLAYLSENYALSKGPSYGNVLAQPVQTIFITILSIVLFHEKLTIRKLFFIGLCIVGIFSISWNGRDMSEYMKSGFILLLFFVFSGICAASHILAQKMVVQEMENLDANITIFSGSGLLALIPILPSMTAGELSGVRPSLLCWAALLMFGCITGFGFYLNTKALPLVPFYMVPLIQNTMTLFAITWGVLFFGEALTVWIVLGAMLFVTGIIGLRLSDIPRKKA